MTEPPYARNAEQAPPPRVVAIALLFPSRGLHIPPPSRHARLNSTPKAAQTVLSGLMRLLVLMPPAGLTSALNAVSSPLIAKLDRLVPQINDASCGTEAHAARVKEAVGIVALLQCTLRYLDSAPLLPDRRHASLLILEVHPPHPMWPEATLLTPSISPSLTVRFRCRVAGPHLRPPSMCAPPRT